MHSLFNLHQHRKNIKLTRLTSLYPQVARLWADSVRLVVRHARTWMAVCPVNLASSSTWSWKGCGRRAPVCPPAPGVTMAPALHTSAPAPVSTHEDMYRRSGGMMFKLIFVCKLIKCQCWENKTNKNICWCHFCWSAGCKEDCDSCFSGNFCTHCHPGHFLFRGKCENSCPKGMTANATLRECTGETLCSTISCFPGRLCEMIFFPLLDVCIPLSQSAL